MTSSDDAALDLHELMGLNKFVVDELQKMNVKHQIADEMEWDAQTAISTLFTHFINIHSN